MRAAPVITHRNLLKPSVKAKAQLHLIAMLLPPSSSCLS